MKDDTLVAVPHRHRQPELQVELVQPERVVMNRFDTAFLNLSMRQNAADHAFSLTRDALERGREDSFVAVERGKSQHLARPEPL